MRLTFGAIVLVVLSAACGLAEKEEDKNVTNISAHGQTKSHNQGQNCFSCHRSGGGGEGYFVIAGTAYQSDKKSTAPNGTVTLFTKANGEGDKVATVEVDALGNFYTTAAVAFEKGLFAVYTPENGASQYMGTATTTGACNSCHGVSIDRLNSP